MTLLKSTCAAISASFIATASAAVPSDILFILDGSGSMWGQIEGEAKIATAKATMTQLMDDVPGDARLGLMTYGTTSKESCSDVVVLNQLGADRTAIKASISGIKPLGKTPIQNSLSQAIALLSGSEPVDVAKTMVLVSDGIETCDGDPCAVASTAKESGVDMKIHVVGFDVDAETRAQLECIAANGGGKYFDAADTKGFQDAMKDAVVLAQATVEPTPEPEPAAPTVTEIFRDDFDGEDLADHWILTNPDPESYIVEDGVLTMLTTSTSPYIDEAGTNLVTYTEKLPRGDWDAVISFSGELSATGNALYFGLRKDSENFMASVFAASQSSICYKTAVSLEKRSKGESETVGANYRLTVPKLGNCYTRVPLGNEDWDTILGDHEAKISKMTLSKRGRSYTTSFEMEGVTLEDGAPYVVQTSQFTSLRSPGDLSFGIGRFQPANGSAKGEVLIMIDSIVINSVEE